MRRTHSVFLLIRQTYHLFSEREIWAKCEYPMLRARGRIDAVFRHRLPNHHSSHVILHFVAVLSEIWLERAIKKKETLRKPLSLVNFAPVILTKLNYTLWCRRRLLVNRTPIWKMESRAIIPCRAFELETLKLYKLLSRL